MLKRVIKNKTIKVDNFQFRFVFFSTILRNGKVRAIPQRMIKMIVMSKYCSINSMDSGIVKCKNQYRHIEQYAIKGGKKAGNENGKHENEGE